MARWRECQCSGATTPAPRITTPKKGAWTATQAAFDPHQGGSMSAIATDRAWRQVEAGPYPLPQREMPRAEREVRLEDRLLLIKASSPLKALIRHALFNFEGHETGSKTSPLGGLRPALTRLHGRTVNISHAHQSVSSSTQNDEGPFTGTTFFIQSNPH